MIFSVKKRKLRVDFCGKCIKIELGSSGRSDFQKGKPPVDKHPNFKERIS